MMSERSETIICGFAGIGKSTLAKTHLGCVDLESTPFEKDWKRYVKIAKHMSENGYTVLLSCHKELREELYAQNVEYVLALPPKDKKEEYLQRYRNRGNTTTFINLLSDNWEDFLHVLPHEKDCVLVVEDYLHHNLLQKQTLKAVMKI